MKEADIIDALKLSIDQSHPDVVLPIGDDGSIINLENNQQLVTVTDAITVDVHYPAGIEAKAIGHRCLAVNLSDMAAMGGVARWANLVFSMPSIDPNWVKGFIDGFSEIANHNDVHLTGGDTVRGPEFFTVSLQGYIENNQYISRSGAKVGDLIYVSVSLGSAAYGLELIKQNNSALRNNFTDAFLYPKPRNNEGFLIAKYASAMIDVSDGFFIDLQKISSQKGLGFKVDVSKLPVDANLIKELTENKAIEYALSGGDDYELCFTIPHQVKRQFCDELSSASNLAFTCVGEITESNQVLTKGNEIYDLPKEIFEHFE